MVNFLEETTEILKDNGKTWEDVEFICLHKVEIPVEKFKSIANREYDNSYGTVEIPEYKVVGDNWWLERAEYDGKEWWEFKQKPERPTIILEQ